MVPETGAFTSTSILSVSIVANNSSWLMYSPTSLEKEDNVPSVMDSAISGTLTTCGALHEVAQENLLDWRAATPPITGALVALEMALDRTTFKVDRDLTVFPVAVGLPERVLALNAVLESLADVLSMLVVSRRGNVCIYRVYICIVCIYICICIYMYIWIYISLLL